MSEVALTPRNSLPVTVGVYDSAGLWLGYVLFGKENIYRERIHCNQKHEYLHQLILMDFFLQVYHK